ncbi:SMC-Scp complex subunit ScpB, partial [bacterium]|nr:SMC-Scp complex subunit ScpB [bacterium]
MNQTKGIVESLLFASDRPLSVGILQTIIKETDVRQIQEAIESLKKQYDQSGRSFQILELAGGYQICTRPQYAPWVRELFRCRSHSRLSQPALETLAIIAYEQPIVRAEIECLRGVCIDGVLNTLLEKKLITVKGRKISVGRPLLYGT